MFDIPRLGYIRTEVTQRSPVTIHLYVEDADAFVARAVGAGAKITMPLEDMFWGDRYGQLEDRLAIIGRSPHMFVI